MMMKRKQDQGVEGLYFDQEGDLLFPLSYIVTAIADEKHAKAERKRCAQEWDRLFNPPPLRPIGNHREGSTAINYNQILQDAMLSYQQHKAELRRGHPASSCPSITTLPSSDTDEDGQCYSQKWLFEDPSSSSEFPPPPPPPPLLEDAQVNIYGTNTTFQNPLYHNYCPAYADDGSQYANNNDLVNGRQRQVQAQRERRWITKKRRLRKRAELKGRVLPPTSAADCIVVLDDEDDDDDTVGKSDIEMAAAAYTSSGGLRRRRGSKRRPTKDPEITV